MGRNELEVPGGQLYNWKGGRLVFTEVRGSQYMLEMPSHSKAYEGEQKNGA
jgi:hypothetical protein